MIIQLIIKSVEQDSENNQQFKDIEEWSILKENDFQDVNDKNLGKRRIASPSLADGFDRYRFLQMILDGSASKAVRFFSCFFFAFFFFLFLN